MARSAAPRLVAAGGCAVEAGWIWAKARLAQVLLHLAWQRALAGEPTPRPWPWADTWPVARLVGPRGESLLVLADASGESLAFGPGHVAGTAPPGGPGQSVVAGHRDTHLAFLREVAVGDELTVERPDGGAVRYRVVETRVVDERETGVLRRPGDGLILVTCWPLDGVVPRGELRWLVFAEAVRPRTRIVATGDGRAGHRSGARGSGAPG